MLHPFQGKDPHPLLWVAIWAAHAKILVTCSPNHLNYCVIFVVYTQFTKLAAGHIIQTCVHGPFVGDP